MSMPLKQHNNKAEGSRFCPAIEPILLMGNNNNHYTQIVEYMECTT